MIVDHLIGAKRAREFRVGSLHAFLGAQEKKLCLRHIDIGEADIEL